MAEQIADYFIATLASPITSSSTALTVTTSGLPTSPNYSIVIDGNTSIQEACRVTGVSGNTITPTFSGSWSITLYSQNWSTAVYSGSWSI